MRKLVLGITIGLVSLGCSAYLCLLLVEKFAFEKVLYQKSCLHGYMFEKNLLCRWLYDQRTKDLTKMFDAKMRDEVVKKSSYRVAVIGDSMIFGTGVRESQTAVSHLKQILKTHRPVEVWNLSQSGDGIVDNYYKYLTAKKYLEPDLIIIAMYDNDLFISEQTPLPYVNYGENEVFRDLMSVCNQPISTTNNEMFANDNWGYLLNEIFAPSFSPAYANRCMLQEIAHRVANDDKVLWLDLSYVPDAIRSPNNEGWSKDYVLYDTIFYDYHTIVTAAGNQVITTLKDGKVYFETVAPVENHPSVKIHQWYAKVMADELLKNPRWGFIESTNK